MTVAHQGAQDASARVEAAGKRSRLGYLLLVLAFLALVAILSIGLTLDPRKVPSPLIGKLVPQFSRE
ncbi:MAG: hypothetical protein ACT4P8_01995 [Betaproteobacteria bacterium]